LGSRTSAWTRTDRFDMLTALENWVEKALRRARCVQG